METIEQLKAHLAILEKELAEEEKIAAQKEKYINNHPDMVRIILLRKETDLKILTLREKISKMERKVTEQFLIYDGMQTWNHPQFQHKTSGWGESTNIQPEVLSKIDSVSPLYLLTNDDITNAVKYLINKAISEYLGLRDLQTELALLNSKSSELYEKEHNLDRRLRAGFESKAYDIRRNIDELKNLINNPKKYEEQEKRQSKKDEARDRLRRETVLDGIYTSLKIKIPKGEN